MPHARFRVIERPEAGGLHPAAELVVFAGERRALQLSEMQRESADTREHLASDREIGPEHRCGAEVRGSRHSSEGKRGR
jgi:hypothetical protein